LQRGLLIYSFSLAKVLEQNEYEYILGARPKNETNKIKEQILETKLETIYKYVLQFFLPSDDIRAAVFSNPFLTF
jgi:hypothetical protein